ncbi:hypothetical protein EE612_028214, partial [Oryza sativa]
PIKDIEVIIVLVGECHCQDRQTTSDAFMLAMKKATESKR